MARRTGKINTIFTAAVAVLVPKYIYGQYLCKKANAGTAMWKFWHAGLEKINTIFTAAVAVLVPKYIYGQYLCKKANASTAMWKFWHAGQEK